MIHELDAADILDSNYIDENHGENLKYTFFLNNYYKIYRI